jgi:hypothetical protein
MARNREWLPPLGDASWGRFLSMTADEELGMGPTSLGMPSRP